MEPVREAWTDDRLDDLNHKVDDLSRRVDHLDHKVDDLSRRMEEGFRDLRAEMNLRLDALQRTMLQGVIAMSAATLTGFGGLAALIATQL